MIRNRALARGLAELGATLAKGKPRESIRTREAPSGLALPSWSKRPKPVHLLQ